MLAGLGGMEMAGPSLIPVSLAFLDSGQYLNSGEGMFRRPSEGQSLISYLSEQDFGSCADLEKVREAAAACVHWEMYLTAGSVSYFLPWGGSCHGIAIVELCAELQGCALRWCLVAGICPSLIYMEALQHVRASQGHVLTHQSGCVAHPLCRMPLVFHEYSDAQEGFIF